jgi:hypothetical protein
MSKEHKKRPPVFVTAEEIDSSRPVENQAVEQVEAAIVYPKIEISGSQDKSLNGWSVISEDQHTGKVFLVSNDINSEGERASWRRTRVLSHSKWVMHGKWSNALTRADVLPQPIYYKEI